MNIKIEKVQVRKELFHERTGEPYKRNHKVYVWPEGETIVENLVNRRTRPYKVYQKDVLPKAMEVLKAENPEVHATLKDAKFGWRKNCGCSMCPCSPGFVSDKEGGYVYDIHVTISAS